MKIELQKILRELKTYILKKQVWEMNKKIKDYNYKKTTMWDWR